MRDYNKLLLLSPGRTGSSRLMGALCERYGLGGISEPFNWERRYQNMKVDGFTFPERVEHWRNVPDRKVVKCLSHYTQFPNNMANERMGKDPMRFYHEVYLKHHGFQEKLHFYLKYMREFDRTILLSRQDFADCFRSHLLAQYHRTASSNYEWSYSSYYEDRDVPFTKDSQWILNLCLDSFRLVEEVSRRMEIPILYYEDLYTDEERFLKTNKKFNLGLEDYYEKMFNPELRLRLPKETPWRTTE
jgi:hypothetical protein